jgi:hypothetical protein
MSSAAMLHRTLLLALVALALCTPTALARSIDLRSEAPTSSLSGTTDHTSADAIPGRVLRRSFDPYPAPLSPRGAALAQERYYSTYGEPAPPREATTAATDSGDGIALAPFVLGLFAALVIGLGAGSALQTHRHATRAAT